MKTLSLSLILILQTTGLWSHVSETTRLNLISRASDVTASTSVAHGPLPTFRAKTLPVQLANNPLTISAKSALAIDVESATILYAKNTSEKRPIASVTKLASILVILSRHEPDTMVTVPQLPDYPSDAATLGLTPGDKLRLGDLVKASLIPSANDAADTLAIMDSGSVAKFTDRMNDAMKEWGIKDAHFASASGLEDDNNYASASALSKIALLALKNPTMKREMSQQSGTITSAQNRTYTFETTNKLLSSGNFYGMKTGYTLAAGQCFVGLTRIDEHEIVTVVLGSEDRFGATSQLVSWINRTWQWL